MDALFYIRENRSLKEHCGQEHEEWVLFKRISWQQSCRLEEEKQNNEKLTRLVYHICDVDTIILCYYNYIQYTIFIGK